MMTMKKLRYKVGFLLVTLMLAFGMTANADPTSLVQVVTTGITYSHTMEAGNGHVYILPNAKTSGNNITIVSSVAGAIKGHYYWSYGPNNSTTLDLGTFTTTSANYHAGSAYFTPGTLVLVLERVDTTTSQYPSVSYNITYN